MDDAQIRRGRPADTPDYAELALLTAPELLPALFGSESNFKKVMRGSFPRTKNPFSFEHSHFIEMGGRAAGMALALTHDQMSKEQLRTMLLLVRYLKLAFVTQVAHIYRSGEIMAQTVESDSYLANIATYPEFRSRGLGTRLMDAVETEARAAGSRRIVLDVETDNKRAIGFYERLSFRVESKSPILRIKHHYFEFYRMTKELAQAGPRGNA